MIISFDVTFEEEEVKLIEEDIREKLVEIFAMKLEAPTREFKECVYGIMLLSGDAERMKIIRSAIDGEEENNYS